MDTDSSVMHIKTDDFYKDISNDVDRWFDTSNFNKSDNGPLGTVNLKMSLVVKSWQSFVLLQLKYTHF